MKEKFIPNYLTSKSVTCKQLLHKKYEFQIKIQQKYDNIRVKRSDIQPRLFQYDPFHDTDLVLKID